MRRSRLPLTLLAFLVIWIVTLILINLNELKNTKNEDKLLRERLIFLLDKNNQFLNDLKLKEDEKWMKAVEFFKHRKNHLNNELQNGELGKPFILDINALNQYEQQVYYKGWNDHSFSQYVSDKISLNRSLKDYRHNECKEIKWYFPLPSVSVIIIFHNEALSVLLRTVHSVLNRSDPTLLKEIILVDDFSNFGILFDFILIR